jgi:hypothetical protein
VDFSKTVKEQPHISHHEKNFRHHGIATRLFRISFLFLLKLVALEIIAVEFF